MKKKKTLLLDKIINALRKEPWGITFLGLIWTTGPVTYICLQAGYYIGYGKFASLQLTLYFIIYTFFSGILGIIARISYLVTKGHDIEKAEYNFKSLIKKLPDLLIVTKNLTLTECKNKIQRDIITSKTILENPDVTEEAVQTAIYTLSKNRSLSDFAKTTDIYRQNGLHYLIDQEYPKYSKKIQHHYDDISRISPKTANLFIDRLQGIVPSKNYGLTRRDGFLEKIIESGINYDFDMLSYADTYEIILLAIELLHGRAIPYHKIKYIGNTKTIKLYNKSDKLINECYQSISKTNNLIISIICLLDKHLHNNAIFPFITNFSSNNILDEISYALEEIPNKKIYQKASHIYKKIKIEQEISLARYTSYLEINEKLSKDYYINFYDKKHNKNGIKIVKQSISLPNKAKLDVISKLAEVTHHIDVYKSNLKVMNAYSEQIINPKELKYIAYQIFIILDKHLNLQNHNIQSAIDNSRATNFLGVFSNFTTETKSKSILALVKEMNEDILGSLTHTISNVINNHNIILDQKNQDILMNNYDLTENIIQNLTPKDENLKSEPLKY